MKKRQNIQHPTPNIQRPIEEATPHTLAPLDVGRWVLDVGCFLLFLLFNAAPSLHAEPKPVPRVQAIPEPHDEVSFQRDGVEIARYRAGHDGFRPFIYPSNPIKVTVAAKPGK